MYRDQSAEMAAASATMRDELLHAISSLRAQVADENAQKLKSDLELAEGKHMALEAQLKGSEQEVRQRLQSHILDSKESSPGLIARLLRLEQIVDP
jgi:hypothetical protein